VVYAVILGSSTGAGIAVGGKAHDGTNNNVGEWGHNTLPFPDITEIPGPPCFCVKHGCLASWVSGPGFQEDFQRHTGIHIAAVDIILKMRSGDGLARLIWRRYVNRLARGAQLELALTRLADVAARMFGRDHRDTRGAGAAGGLGFGLMTFLGAELLPGFDLVASQLGLEAAIARADLVLTGEGSLDGQTLEGKAPAGVAVMARRLGRPVIAFGGRVQEAARIGLCDCFDQIVALSDVEPELTQEQRIARGAELLSRHAARLAARVAANASRKGGARDNS
jgi:predicted NBD/HSP70 family sugar kinase